MENFPPHISDSSSAVLLSLNMASSQAIPNVESKNLNGYLGLRMPESLGINESYSQGNSTLTSECHEMKLDNKRMRKPRCAFQTRSQIDILDDGYRWRKYGQKAVKNNKFPRSYYRCTYQGCNVKKQVQRLTKDEGIVVTTYEGVHSHPIEKCSDNFEHILNQMQIYASY